MRCRPHDLRAVHRIVLHDEDPLIHRRDPHLRWRHPEQIGQMAYAGPGDVDVLVDIDHHPGSQRNWRLLWRTAYHGHGSRRSILSDGKVTRGQPLHLPPRGIDGVELCCDLWKTRRVDIEN